MNTNKNSTCNNLFFTLCKTAGDISTPKTEAVTNLQKPQTEVQLYARNLGNILIPQ
jgi:hypothetical protein